MPGYEATCDSTTSGPGMVGVEMVCVLGGDLNLLDFVICFRWCKPCINIAGRCRTLNAATNIVSLSSSVSKSPQKDKSSLLIESLSSMTCVLFSNVTGVKCC